MCMEKDSDWTRSRSRLAPQVSSLAVRVSWLLSQVEARHWRGTAELEGDPGQRPEICSISVFAISGARGGRDKIQWCSFHRAPLWTGDTSQAFQFVFLMCCYYWMRFLGKRFFVKIFSSCMIRQWNRFASFRFSNCSPTFSKFRWCHINGRVYSAENWSCNAISEVVGNPAVKG